MYPEGHARNTSGQLDGLLEHKFRRWPALGVEDVDALHRRFTNLERQTPRKSPTCINLKSGARRARRAAGNERK